MYENCGLEHLNAAQAFWLGVGATSFLTVALLIDAFVRFGWRREDKRREP